jgi:subtilisin family serine protease
MKERSDAQVALILEAVRGNQVEVHRGAAGTVDYIRRQRLLTDVDDVPVVYEHLGRTPPPRRERRNTKLEKLHRFDVDLPHGQSLDELLDELDKAVRPGAVTPDYLLHVCTTWCGATEPYTTTATEPADRNRSPEATGSDVRVAVVDTGKLEDVVQAHDWLRLPTLIDGDEEPDDIGHYAGHGTFIAGVVRAYAPESLVRVESVTTMGGTVFESDMVDQLIEALERDHPQVISFSGGTRTRGDRPLKSFEMFYEEHLRALGDDTVMVCAAGNDGDEGKFWPAAFDWAVGVGALDDDRATVANYSNRGDWVDVYALGTDVLNAYPDQPYTYMEPPDLGLPAATFPTGMASWSGTSFATPMVAGLIAARMSRSPRRNARQSCNEVLAFAAGDPDPEGRPRLRNANAATS